MSFLLCNLLRGLSIQKLFRMVPKTNEHPKLFKVFYIRLTENCCLVPRVLSCLELYIILHHFLWIYFLAEMAVIHFVQPGAIVHPEVVQTGTLNNYRPPKTFTLLILRQVYHKKDFRSLNDYESCSWICCLGSSH